MPEILDKMKGVIRDVGNSDVSVSLFKDDEEFCLDIPIVVFKNGKVELREDVGFDFWVERKADGSELPVARPLPVRELSRKDWIEINKEIDELLNGTLDGGVG